ncbi:MAG: putative acyltransferase [Caulobacteraceae bacterium]|nr:putative acyltransferase [Caulobacteraceae bacterium]
MPAPPSPVAPPDDRKIGNIERLRGLAALAVVICHIAGHFYGFTRDSPGPERLFAWLGQAGVALFFVISGFCIRLPEARALAGGGVVRLDVREFLARRFIRIAPPYWLALAASIAVGALIETELIDGARGPVDIAAHALVLHTLWPSTFLGTNGVFWTIGLEVHFYLAYLLFANRPARVWTAAALLALGLAVFGAASTTLPADNPWRIVGQGIFLTSFWQWYLGALIADWWVQRRPAAPAAVLWMARAVAVAAALSLGLADPRVLGLHINGWILPFAAAAIVALFVVRPAHSPAPSRLLEPFNLLGRASYSLYLFHPVALSLAAFAILQGALPAWAGPATCLALAILLAMASYALVERPLLRWRSRLRRNRASSVVGEPAEAATA